MDAIMITSASGVSQIAEYRSFQKGETLGHRLS
jgi:hypothetical protein